MTKRQGNSKLLFSETTKSKVARDFAVETPAQGQGDSILEMGLDPTQTYF